MVLCELMSLNEMSEELTVWELRRHACGVCRGSPHSRAQ